MKKIMNFRFLLLFAISILFVTCDEEEPPELAGGIYGTVTNYNTDEPINGVSVSLSPGNKTSKTGSDGKYEFTGLEPGSFTLQIQDANYQTNKKTVTVDAGIKSQADFDMIPISSDILVSETYLDFSTTENSKVFYIENSGSDDITYQIKSSKTWLSFSPSSGTLTTQKELITITANRAALSEGTHTGDIVVNSQNNNVTLSVSITIIAPAAPTVNITPATGITNSSVQLSATLAELGSTNVTDHGFCYATSPNPTTNNQKVVLGAKSETGTFTTNLTGLSQETVYYIRAYAINSVGTSYSTQINFTTLGPPELASVSTSDINSYDHESAEVEGNISDLGDGFVIQHGHCWSTNQNPTIENSKTELGSKSEVGIFTSSLTGLTEQTTYYVKAYATNSVGTTYGSEVTLTTESAPPVVTSGLAAYYNFDDGTAADWTGNFNGIMHDCSPSDDTPNALGKSMQFDNGADQIRVLNGVLNGFTSMSVSYWIKTTSSAGYIYGYLPQNSGSGQTRMKLSSNTIWTSVSHSEGSLFAEASSIFDGNWHHIIMVNNTIEAQRKLYIDGNLFDNIISFNIAMNNYTLQIGAVKQTSFYDGDSFIGKIDNLRFYNRVLSQSEITEIFEAKQ